MLNEIKKILIVDDHISNCILIEKFLKQHNYHYTSVYNATDALSSIKNNNHLLVLLDIELPDMSGLGILEEIRKNNSYHRKSKL